eukprot:1491246-Rhodomonas_salina.1
MPGPCSRVPGHARALLRYLRSEVRKSESDLPGYPGSRVRAQESELRVLFCFVKIKQKKAMSGIPRGISVSYTHLRAHETEADL